MPVCEAGVNLDVERMMMNAWRIRINPRAVNGALAVSIGGGDGACRGVGLVEEDEDDGLLFFFFL
jgi:hypothetical protein